MNFTEIKPLQAPPGFGQLQTVPATPSIGDDIPAGALAANPDTKSLGFGAVLDAINAGGAALEHAQSAENAYINGTGGLQEMVFERAKADTIVSVASAATSRVAQSLNSLSQMQL